ncbi:MAG: hypothetical protein R3A49_09020 [Acidimicrobiia bacterium]
MTLDFSTVLLQWAAGGLAFTWVTTRHREVSLGFGWVQRAVWAAIALCAGLTAVVLGDSGTGAVVRTVCSFGTVVAALSVLAVSVAMRKAGVSGARADRERRRERVAAMLDDSESPSVSNDEVNAAEVLGDKPVGREFPPVLDLVAPTVALIGLCGAASADGGDYALTLSRLVVGAAFLGVITDAMLLGHWYLMQPGLGRGPIRELVVWSGVLWPFEVVVYLVPTGMISVINGTIDDGWGGLLGWTWLACAAATIILIGVAYAAVRERYYSAVMATTGLLYLAILTAFGQDLVARAVLSP